MVFRRGEWITAEDVELPTPRGAVAEATPDGATEGHAAATAALSWLQREALRLARERRELRRRDVIARCGISRETARRELAALVRLGFLRLVGRGRGARYVPLSFWLGLIRDAVDWVGALV